MRFVLLVLIISANCEASVFKSKLQNFCAKYFVADDPWPYVQYSDTTLIKLYNLYYERQDKPAFKEVNKEIQFRIKNKFSIG